MATIINIKPRNTFPTTITIRGKRWRFGTGYPHCNAKERDIRITKERYGAKYGRIVEFHEKFKDGWVRKTQAVYIRNK